MHAVRWPTAADLIISLIGKLIGPKKVTCNFARIANGAIQVIERHLNALASVPLSTRHAALLLLAGMPGQTQPSKWPLDTPLEFQQEALTEPDRAPTHFDSLLHVA